MSASDGAFNAKREGVTAQISTEGWASGRHLILVESQDAAGNWGVPERGVPRYRVTSSRGRRASAILRACPPSPRASPSRSSPSAPARPARPSPRRRPRLRPARAPRRSGAPRALPQEDVSLAVDRGLWHLGGTLTLPARDEGARVPLVVIVHGSGPMSRDGVMRGQIGLGFGFELPVYQRLAAALSARGFAVYRYDKRTCGAFNDCADEGPSSIPYSMLAEAFSTSEYVHDAEAALDTVARHPSIDPERTFFIGHSEGGQLVPVLLTERPAVRAGVLLAPPFHTMSVVLEQQSERVRWSFALAGRPERGEIDARQLHDAAHALGQIERGTHLGDPILGQPPSMWASWIALAGTAPALARELQRPPSCWAGATITTSYRRRSRPGRCGSTAHPARRIGCACSRVSRTRSTASPSPMPG